ncbi:GH25 family lysozyme [Streptomyces tsukubensis]|uniref:Muramidase n=1 Tax=Streptomyces tsukubensis TaxID=83656 RepID=A0A1V4AGF5_9ACTN|nr:GH25 family lysozyme [Streptomyces tsukubensis]OON82691.1 muramidase [Streptomyces tsukubensis]QFR92136.1 muramidase [Streptomyces tsukubensis]
MTVKGIDVSSYQESFDAKDAAFVFVKATEGRSYINPKQTAQAKKARNAGCVVGFYHFLWPGNIEAQAEYFVEKCASVEGDVLAVDWETTGDGSIASNGDKDKFIKAVQRLRGSTHRVLLYCNRDFWLNRDVTSFAGDGLWIADYGAKAGKPRIQASWKFHQYTSSPIDTNIGNFADRAALRKWAEK